MYIKRLIEQRLLSLSEGFKVILLMGARQVGKSTLLQYLFPHARYFVFDPIQDLYNVRQDPDLFLDNFPAPLILDEIQYAPELVAAIKRRVDKDNTKGQYFLSGSQNLSMLKTVSETLAGRVGIVTLHPFSTYEMAQHASQSLWLEQYLQSPYDLVEKFAGTFNYPQTLFQMLWRGTMPGILELSDDIIADYFQSYRQTYLDRDIQAIETIKDLSNFNRFLSICAAVSAQEINYSQLGRELNVTHTTAARWITLLQQSFQWSDISAFRTNAIKKASKKPKGYLCDTGLASFLLRLSSPEALASSLSLGAMFETFCVNNIRAMASGVSSAPQLYHWRSDGGAEVDLVLERDRKFFPIEMKCKTQVAKKDASGIKRFRAAYEHLDIQPGLILYAGSECYKIDENIIAFPWHGFVQ